jgi:hypothetical protein
VTGSADGGRTRRVGRMVLLLLVAGWLLGLIVQVAVYVSTGRLDVLPPSILLGIALCAGAGATERLCDAAPPRARRGVSAGIAMVSSIAIGYVLFVSVVSGPTSDGAGGETWLSLLLVAPLWIGIPAVAGAVFGAFGWLLADRAVG